jgi:hypothetical protein
MTNTAVHRVSVGVDPFVLRSALHMALTQDGRFQSMMCPRDRDPGEEVANVEADAILVSRPIELPQVLVVTVCQSAEVELRSDGERRTVPYEGLDHLAELLALELSGSEEST